MSGAGPGGGELRAGWGACVGGNASARRYFGTAAQAFLDASPSRYSTSVSETAYADASSCAHPYASAGLPPHPGVTLTGGGI